MYYCRPCRKYHQFGLDYQCPIYCYNPVNVFPKMMILTSSIVSNTAKFECTVCLDNEGLLCEEHALLQIDEDEASFANMILLLRERASFHFQQFHSIKYVI